VALGLRHGRGGGGRGWATAAISAKRGRGGRSRALVGRGFSPGDATGAGEAGRGGPLPPRTKARPVRPPGRLRLVQVQLASATGE